MSHKSSGFALKCFELVQKSLYFINKLSLYPEQVHHANRLGQLAFLRSSIWYLPGSGSDWIIYIMKMFRLKHAWIRTSQPNQKILIQPLLGEMKWVMLNEKLPDPIGFYRCWEWKNNLVLMFFWGARRGLQVACQATRHHCFPLWRLMIISPPPQKDLYRQWGEKLRNSYQLHRGTPQSAGNVHLHFFAFSDLLQ